MPVNGNGKHRAHASGKSVVLLTAGFVISIMLVLTAALIYMLAS